MKLARSTTGTTHSARSYLNKLHPPSKSYNGPFRLSRLKWIVVRNISDGVEALFALVFFFGPCCSASPLLYRWPDAHCVSVVSIAFYGDKEAIPFFSF